MKTKDKVFFILYPILACVILFYIEQILKVDYVSKSTLKIIMFFVLPYLILKLSNKNRLHLNSVLKENVFLGISSGIYIGLAVFAIIFIAYVVFKPYIDFHNIVFDLTSKLKINKSNYIFVALYICLINSLLEETFFRKYIFLSILELGKNNIAYFISAALFSIYHIAIFKTWFQIWISILCLVALFATGLFLNYVNKKSGSVKTSWTIHFFANVAILLIGYMYI